MITKTDFQRSDAGSLVEYIERDNDCRVPVKDKTGKRLSEQEMDQFVEQSRRFQAERHLIIAPDPTADYSASEVDRFTRRTMRQWRTHRSSAQYVYAVHQPEGKTHAHVAATGRMEDLRMDKEDLKEFRELARETFRERQRIAQRQKISNAQQRRQQAALEREVQSEAEQVVTAEQEAVPEAEQISEAEPEAEPETMPDFE
ncbi:MAG: relaxase/mobilization nuclease domain-containing protein [Halobacteriaceae archaeon]